MQFSAENDFLTLGDKKTFRDKTVTGNKYVHSWTRSGESSSTGVKSNQIKSIYFRNGRLENRNTG